jgi:hypothetical protein
VAHNEERNLEASVRSLLEQDLPSGVWWHALWIVASGCTDGTVEVAERLAREDPRVNVLVEAERRGKASALGQVFQRAHGNALVLLNADARAEPGAVAELVRVGMVQPAPYAVMGRPVIPHDHPSRWAPTLRTMWNLHHEFHCELQRLGGGAHLSDELLLVSLPFAPPLPEGIINDGSYFGVWLAQHGGRRLYAPEARARIEIPGRMRDHLHQRRRIQYGNDQVASALGAAPSTLGRYALRHPGRAFDVVRRSVRSEPQGFRRLAQLGLAEIVAKGLASWDHVVPWKDHVRWQRIRPTGSPFPGRTHASTAERSVGNLSGTPPPSPGNEGFEIRVRTILRTAAQFDTGVRLSDLLKLLPPAGPQTVDELRSWLAARPGLARLDRDRALPDRSIPESLPERERRAQRFRAVGREVVNRDLEPVRSLFRCIAITGSTAYGYPEADADLDLFVVTRSGALWWCLAFAYLRLRIRALRSRSNPEPPVCLNYMLDDRAAPTEWARAQGFLFAREALTAEVLAGDEYYRGLLRAAPWMAAEVPRLYSERALAPAATDARPAPWPVRLANLAIFPFLATYLQLVGLRRNALRRAGRQSGSQFQSDTRPKRMAFASEQFDALRWNYERSIETTFPGPGISTGSHLPSSR